MKNKILTIITNLFLIIIFYGCTNPMDIQTPRDKKYIKGEDYKLKGSISDFRFEENGTLKNFIVKDSYISIDTTQTSPRLWLRLKLDDYSQDAEVLDRMCIQSLDLNLDSVDISSSYIFNDRRRDNNKLSMKIERGLNTSKDTTVYAGDNFITTEISFNLNKLKGEMYAYVMAKLYDHKIWLEYRDSTYIDYIMVTRLDTTYDQYGNIVVKEVTDTIPKEVKIRIEEEKRKRDSLFLTGKFKMTF